MAEYIDREAAIEAVKKERDYTGKFTFEEEHAWAVGFQQGITFALSDVYAIPAADVRPVVLCRDCKYNMANIPDIQDGININENWNACQLTELYDSVKPDDFCSRGEKREES